MRVDETKIFFDSKSLTVTWRDRRQSRILKWLHFNSPILIFSVCQSAHRLMPFVWLSICPLDFCHCGTLHNVCDVWYGCQCVDYHSYSIANHKSYIKQYLFSFSLHQSCVSASFLVSKLKEVRTCKLPKVSELQKNLNSVRPLWSKKLRFPLRYICQYGSVVGAHA